jgi:two-component system, NtrC family, nitrogen regulation response regulator NtrX
MSTAPSTLKQPIGNNKTALIVDNDENIQRLLQGILHDLGFKTLTTWSGYEALALIKSDNLDVLVVDDYVPDLHFHDLLKRVGRLPIQPWVVVMQAAAPTSQELRRYALLGASRVVRKDHVGEICKAVSACCIEDPLARTWVH